MLQCFCMIDYWKRKEYMQEYRRTHRDKFKEYNDAWLSKPGNAEKHREACRRYYYATMDEEKREKNREYQKAYYRRKKKEKEQKQW